MQGQKTHQRTYHLPEQRSSTVAAFLAQGPQLRCHCNTEFIDSSEDEDHGTQPWMGGNVYLPEGRWTQAYSEWWGCGGSPQAQDTELWR